METHRALRIELAVEDHRQDLIAEGVDIAIRFGKLADSAAVSRVLGRWPLILAASPAYLEKHGTPSAPDDLSSHSVVMAGPASATTWSFRRGEDVIAFKPEGQLSISSSEVGVNAGLAGLGIIAASYPSLRDHISEGELLRILGNWDIGNIECHALFPSGQAAKPAARVFAEYLRQQLRDIPD